LGGRVQAAVAGRCTPMSAYGLALLGVTGIALARSVSVILFFVRNLLRRKTTVATKWGGIEFLVIPEPILLAGFAYSLYAAASPESPSLARQAAALCGAFVALGGGWFGLWTFLSLPSMSSGHYVLPQQRIVKEGPYALVRHPVYLCAFLIWLALPIGYLNILSLIVFAVYVVPSYIMYMREEERMMAAHYGDEYLEYQSRVGMLFPRFQSRG
jgi:protein-S-isoprenylcysteine O-methyltransferase Ste14